jgi:hypothetical protein
MIRTEEFPVIDNYMQNPGGKLHKKEQNHENQQIAYYYP